jgi:hypothetical protein
MTIEHIIVHDTRLRGTVSPQENARLVRTHCETTDQISTRVNDLCSGGGGAAQSMQVSSRIRDRADSVPVPVISILAHGASIESGPLDWVMQLGTNCVDKNNAREFGRSIRRCVSDRIRVLCCNAAGTDDAKATMRALAQGAGVPVFASTTNQRYARGLGTGDRVLGYFRREGEHGGWINFGRWEGVVMRFPPSGGEGTVAFRGDPLSSTPASNPEDDPYQVVCQ